MALEMSRQSILAVKGEIWIISLSILTWLIKASGLQASSNDNASPKSHLSICDCPKDEDFFKLCNTTPNCWNPKSSWALQRYASHEALSPFGQNSAQYEEVCLATLTFFRWKGLWVKWSCWSIVGQFGTCDKYLYLCASSKCHSFIFHTWMSLYGWL